MQFRPGRQVRLVGVHFLAMLAACGCDAGGTLGPSPDRNAIALDDFAVTTAEDTPATVTIPFTASDRGAVALRVGHGPDHGALSAANATWTYTPGADFAGTDQIVIVAEDARGAFYGQATATLTITVTPVNDAPVARPDGGTGFSTNVNTALTIAERALLDNDSDADGDRVTLTGVAAASDGHGVPVISGGDVVFTPDAGYDGTATFSYTISDGQATATATASVAVAQPPHAAPVAGDDAMAVDEAANIVIDDSTLLGNDSDPEHLPLTISRVDAAITNSKIVANVSHSGTQVTIHPFGKFYGVARFTYFVSNGYRQALGFVTLTIKPTPLATDVSVTVLDAASSVKPGGKLTYYVDVGVDGDHGVDVTVADVLPDGLACTWRCEPLLLGDDTCTNSGTGSIHDAVHLGSYGAVMYTLACTVSASTTATSIAHTATVTSASWVTDTDPSNNTATDTNAVTP